MRNKFILILSILVAILTLIFTTLGVVGYLNGNHNNMNDKDDKPNNTETKMISENDVNKLYYENLSANMKEYFDKNGYFEGTGFSDKGNYIKYKITPDYSLILLADSVSEKHIDKDVITVNFINCGMTEYLCLRYTKTDQSLHSVSDIFQKDSNLITNIKELKISETTKQVYESIEKRYAERIDTFIYNYREQYKSLMSTIQNNENARNASTRIYEFITKKYFNIEYNNEDLLLTSNGEIIDENIIQVKILYFNNKPIIYYWKSDGYWYSYDYYNKLTPVTTKIDLDYIIDVTQFTYDTGETIPLFVDIEGNLKEFK